MQEKALGEPGWVRGGARYWCAVNHVQVVPVPVTACSRGEGQVDQSITRPLGGRSLRLLCIR